MTTPIPDPPNHAQAVADSGGLASQFWYQFFTKLVSALKGQLSEITNALPVSGSVTFAAATTATVTFATAEAGTYNVYFSAPDNKSYWATSKTTGGFTANASSAHTGAVPYIIVRN